MRAFVFPEPGSTPEVRDIDIPEPGEGEVRVRVEAASVNGFDLSVAAGYLVNMMEHRFPVVLGKDFSGTIDAVGSGVSGFTSGDRVFGVVTKTFLGDGSFAEYVTVPVAVGLAKLPDVVDFTHGAALGLAGTAALMSVEAAAIQLDETVLIVGATSGVGSQAVQLAKRAGARVVATANSDEGRQLVSELGADETVDYQQDVAATMQERYPDGVDVVLHFADDPAETVSVVRRGGRYCSTRIMSADQVAVEHVSVLPIFADPAPDILERLAAHEAQGVTRVVIERTYPLDQAPQALADFASGTLGKLVITTR
mgnify:CR=1 FL=1